MLLLTLATALNVNSIKVMKLKLLNPKFPTPEGQDDRLDLPSITGGTRFKSGAEKSKSCLKSFSRCSRASRTFGEKSNVPTANRQ